MPTTDSLLPESPHFDSAALEQALQMPEVGWAEEERDEDDES